MADSACVTIILRTRDAEAYLQALEAAGRNKPDENYVLQDREQITAMTWHSTTRLDASDWYFENIPFYGDNDSGGGEAVPCEYACDGLVCDELPTWDGDVAIRVPNGHDMDQPLPIDEGTKKFMLLLREAKKLVDAG